MKQYIWLIIALFLFAYGIIIALAGSGTPFFLFWIILSLLSVGMHFALRVQLWQQLPATIQKGVSVLLILGTLLFLFVEGCIISQFFSKGEPNLDYIIVLGAQVKENGPSKALRYRLDKAYDYLISNPDTQCIVSGGQGYNEPWSEAQGMYDYLVGRGIEPSRIQKEDQSVNTVENITFSEALLDKSTDQVGIVSNNFHVFRATKLAKRAGYSHVCGISSRCTFTFLLNNMVREFFGILKDFLYGYL